MVKLLKPRGFLVCGAGLKSKARAEEILPAFCSQRKHNAQKKDWQQKEDAVFGDQCIKAEVLFSRVL